MEADYQYQADYAKSGRASCTKCRTSIAQDSLRIARLVQSANFDGKIPKWFHFNCFFTKNVKLSSTSEIKNFDGLRWEDQEKIRSALNETSSLLVPTVKFTIKLSDPDNHCAVCDKPLLQERHMIQKDGKEHRHLTCFFRSNECPTDISTLTGFKKLKKVDRDAVLLAHTETKKANLKRSRNGSNGDVSKSKKPKISEDEEKSNEQNALRLQSKKLWKIHDTLEREVSKDALVGLLEYNKQHVPTGLSNLLDAVSDAMLFGALPTCPSCSNGPLSYSNGQYKCSAMATDWAPCLYRTRDVERLPFRVPKEYHDVDFLKNYKYIKRNRLFASDSAPLVTGPLSKRTILVTEAPHDSGKSKEALEKELRALGATITQKLADDVLIVSSPTSMEQAMKPKQTDRARSLGLRIVDEAFIAAVQAMSAPVSQAQLTKMLTKHTISDWYVNQASGELSLTVVDHPRLLTGFSGHVTNTRTAVAF